MKNTKHMNILSLLRPQEDSQKEIWVATARSVLMLKIFDAIHMLGLSNCVNFNIMIIFIQASQLISQ